MTALAFIPEPHKIAYGKGWFKTPANGSIGISDSSLHDAAGQVASVLGELPVSILRPGLKYTISMTLNPRLRSDGYRLKIAPAGIAIQAQSQAGAFYAVQTLTQIVGQCPKERIPVLSIDDWPDFKDRGVYYDVCRGRVPKTERLMQQAALLAHFKINHYQLYVEHTFKFKGHPDIGKDASPLTPGDIMLLDELCKALHIEFVPSLASFGHLSTVLKHPQYHQLAEDWGVGRYVSPEAGKIKAWQKHIAWSLSPANPKTYAFLDELFSEFLPAFSSKRFNMCCDETFDLGLGQTYELCKKLGKGRVYLNHIGKLNRICRKYGKKTMFWGDIIRHYPDLVKEIPRDVTVLHWGYSYDFPYETCKDFKKAGINFLGCPGVSSWVSLFPRLPEATANIRGFALAAKKYGGSGLLNTDWGDGGHYNFMEYSWHGYLFGAEQSWNVKADPRTFTARFARLFFGSADKDLIKAIDLLGEISYPNVDGYYQSIWQHIYFAKSENDIFNEKERKGRLYHNGKFTSGPVKLDAAFGRKTLEKLAFVREAFEKVRASGGADPHEVLDYWLFAVDTIAHAARRLTVRGPGGSNTPAKRKAIRTEMRSLMNRFTRLWLARNRTSEIRVTLKRYRDSLKSWE
ncbi:MAG: hypothetical protein C0404_06435 [Verrucomicrobia bacterium]|nr:hypothetical protein [Verrucomicrobiota bacterium]